MSAQEVVAVAVAVLVPIATTTAGVVNLLLQDRRMRRSRAGRRQTAFEDAAWQVALAAEVGRGCCSPQRRQCSRTPPAWRNVWLDDASELVSRTERALIDEVPHVPVSRLLFHRVRWRSAKIIRIGFCGTWGAIGYGSMGLLSGVLGGAVRDALVGETLSAVLIGGVRAAPAFWEVSAAATGPSRGPLRGRNT